MGNRAVVRFNDEAANDVGVYLHWNGGPESIAGFLQAMVQRKWTRMDYAPARFIQVVGEYFDSDGDDSGLSLGVYEYESTKGMADYDNYEYQVDLMPDEIGTGFNVSNTKRNLAFQVFSDSIIGLDDESIEKAQSISGLLKAIRDNRSRASKAT